MTKPARFSYAVLATVLILVGFLQLGAPFLALLFAYFVLTKLGRFIPNKWVVLAVFLIVLAAISFARPSPPCRKSPITPSRPRPPGRRPGTSIFPLPTSKVSKPPRWPR